MRILGPEPGADCLAGEGLDEDPEVQMAGEEVAQATGGGHGEDDHHTGADGFQEGDAEQHHQGDLDEGGGADAKGPGEEAVDHAGDDAQPVELSAGKQFLTGMEVAAEPVGLIYLGVEEGGAGAEHDGGHGAQERGWQQVGYIGPDKGAHDAAQPHGQACGHLHFPLFEVAVSPGEHGEGHGGQSHGYGSMDGHLEGQGQQGDGDPGAAGSHEADDGTHDEHGNKYH